MRISHGVSKEEKVAVRVGMLLSDLDLDLEAVASYLGRSTSHLVFSRVIEVLESAQYQMEQINTNRLDIRSDWQNWRN